MIQALLILGLARVQAQPPMPAPAISQAVQGISLNLADGAKVSGTVTVEAIVHTSDIVTKVEFYQGGQMILAQSSTPYKFQIDTTLVPDGDLKLKFIAYTDTGGQITKSLTLKVDNGLSAGVGPHLKKGTDAITNGDYDTALSEGQTALRIDGKNVAAQMLVARAFYGKKVYDQAQNFCDNILAADPNNADALNLSSAIGIQQAFGVIAKKDNASQSLDNITQALNYAIDNRSKYLDIQLGKLNIASTDPAVYAAEAIKAHRNSLAVQALTTAFNKDQSSTKMANWLTFAQFSAGRFSDAAGTMSLFTGLQSAKPDAYTKAMRAMLAAHVNDMSTADKLLSDAILDDMSNLGVRTAQASISLSENNLKSEANLVQGLATDAGQYPEVNYLLSATANQLGQYDLARSALKAGLLADASNYTLYVEAGNQALQPALTSKEDKDVMTAQYAIAKMFFNAAMRAKGDSAEGLTGLAIVDVLQGDAASAVNDATAATKASPDYAAAQYALAMALSAAGKNDDAMTAMTIASKLDVSRLDGMGIPSAARCWQYFTTGGRTLVIAAPNQ